MNRLRLIIKVLQEIRCGEVMKSEEKKSNKNEVLYFQTDELMIHNPSLAPLHVDGDPAVTGKYLTIKILPAAFKLIQPLPSL